MYFSEKGPVLLWRARGAGVGGRYSLEIWLFCLPWSVTRTIKTNRNFGGPSFLIYEEKTNA